MRCVRFAVLSFAACTGQITSDGTNGAASPDAASGGGGSLDAATGDAAGFSCRNQATNAGSGHHNPGQDCQNSCHNHGFTLAGTLFSSPSAATPIAGATITVIDRAGKMLDIVSQANGTSTPRSRSRSRSALRPASAPTWLR